MTGGVVTDPAELADLFKRDRETHLYGLGDLDEPFWTNSTWYRNGDAAVGRVGAGGDWVTGYAMTRIDPEKTILLFLEVMHTLPSGTWVTGPLGLFEASSRERKTISKGTHHRMILVDPPNDTFEGVDTLGPEHLGDLARLHASDPGESFFLPMLLDDGMFVGIWDEDLLVASAGTHLMSRSHGVAAIGSLITRPSHRGRGLGRQVVGALAAELAGRYRTIGLNVAKANTAAVRLYQDLGFVNRFDYEEIQLL